jgi:hypothetical protein
MVLVYKYIFTIYSCGDTTAVGEITLYVEENTLVGA